LINKSYLQSLTEADRDEMRAKAAQSRLDKKEASANIRSMADENYWRELFSKYSLRSPPSTSQASETKYLKRASRKLDVDINIWIRDVCGCASLREIVSLNSNIGAKGMLGIFMEWVDEEKLA
jgi:hypothetical protein